MAQYIFPLQTLQALHPHSPLYHPTSPDFFPESGQPSASASADSLSPLPVPPPASLSRSNPTLLPVSLLQQFTHTFLIRTPVKGVPSYWSMAQQRAAGFEYFDAAEAGYKELALLYAWLSDPLSDYHTTGSGGSQKLPLPLIDAATLLADPEYVVEQYCSAVGVPFAKSMLSWEASNADAEGTKKQQPVESSGHAPTSQETQTDNANGTGSFAQWGAYHAVAEQSTGFKKEEAPAPAPAAAAAAQPDTQAEELHQQQSPSQSSKTYTDKNGKPYPQEVVDAIE